MSFSVHHPAIPGYELIRELAIGCGGNGAIIYVARSVRLDKVVVLQVRFPPRISVQGGDVAGPARMASLLGLGHPNILGVLEVGEVDRHVYVALEYVEGVETLGDRLRRGPLPEAKARGLASVIASVLQFVRNRGVAVAILTPGDVLLSATPKLILHPMCEGYVGPDFMAPEEEFGAQQATGTGIDVYRVGALLYAMLTGQSPVSFDSARLHLRRSVLPPVPVRQINPVISKTVEAICMKCLEDRPDRYGTLEELIESIDRAGQTFTSRLIGRWTRLAAALVRA